MQPHEPTTTAVGSPLYDVVSNLRQDDTVRCSATFIPYVSPKACYGNDTSYFALVRFNRIQRLGYDMSLE